MTQAKQVAIIDDESDLRESVAQWLKLSDFEPTTYETAEAALRDLRPDFNGIVLTDIKMPGMDGMSLLRRIQTIDPGLPTIMMTGHGDVPMAVEAMRIGAFNFIEKPFDPEKLKEICLKAGSARAQTMETRALRRDMSDNTTITRRFMGDCPPIVKLRETMLDVAQADGHILINGETGSGKSLMASVLHACGPRASKPMVTMNCVSIPRSEIQNVLFGSADETQKPLIEQAEGGILCIENVESLPSNAQARLVEWLDTAESDGLGNRAIQLRIIATTGSNASGIKATDTLRQDLYYRLAGIVLDAPPLRARGEDVLMLFTHFLQQFAEEYGCDVPAINAADAANLVQAPWPGNVRQLINLAERAILQSLRGDLNISALLIDDGFDAPTFAIDTEKPLKEHVEAFEKMLIEHALRRHQGSVSSVMTELALPRRTLNEKMAKYKLVRQDYI